MRLPEIIPGCQLLLGYSVESACNSRLVGFGRGLTEGATQNEGRTLVPVLHAGEGHLVTVAPTGAGKGVGCIIPALLRYPGPVVVIDPKGENYWVTARRRRELGQKVIALDPFRILDIPEDERGRFNPLDFLSPENPSLVEDAEMIANILMSSAGDQHHDRFWPYMGAQLLTLLLLYQVKRLDPDDWTLGKTRDLLAKTPQAFIELGSELAKERDPELRRLAGVVANPAEATFGGYWAFSQMQTACFKGKLVGECIASSSFSLQQLVDGEPLSIYLVIPPEKLESHGNLLKLWLSVMVAALTQRRSRPERSTLFLIDEAAQLGHMPQLRQAVTLLRGYGVRVWSFWQDLSQIKALYPRTWETILNNSQVHQFFGHATALGAEQTHSVTGLGSTGRSRGLADGHMILSLAGREPIIARVPDYRTDPAFRGLYDPNPYHHDGVREDEDGHVPRSSRVFRKILAPARTVQRMAAQSAPDEEPGLSSGDGGRSTVMADTDRESKSRVLDAARSLYHGLEGIGPGDVDVEIRELPFYEELAYCELRVVKKAGHAFGRMLHGPAATIPLDGSAQAIHDLNKKCDLCLEPSQVRAYLRFFCDSILGEEGRFLVVEDPGELRFMASAAEGYQEKLKELIEPVSWGRSPDSSSYRATATVLYGRSLFRAVFKVHHDGTLEMTDDDELLSSIPVMSDTEALGPALRIRR